MQFSRSFLFAYLLVPVFCSCVRDVAMDAEEDPEVTVACILTDEPVQTLQLSYTKGASLAEAPDLPEATTVLTDLTDNKEVGRFSRTADGSWQLSYAAIPGHSYRLDVTVPDHEPIWAEQTMPEEPGIEAQWDWWRENLPENAKYRMNHGYVFSAGNLRSPTWFYGINFPNAESAGEITERLSTDYPEVDSFNEIPSSVYSGEDTMLWDCWFRTSAYPDLAGMPNHRRYLRFPVRDAERTEFLVSGDFRNYMADPTDFVHSDKRFSELRYFSASEEYDHYLVDSYLLDQAGSSTDLSEIFLRENVYTNIQGAVGIFGAKVERSLRWDDDRWWGEGPFCLSSLEKGATSAPPSAGKYDYAALVRSNYQNHKPFSLLLYEVRAGHPKEWKYVDDYDPSPDHETLTKVEPHLFLIENEDLLREHGMDEYGPVDFSTKNVLVAYLSSSWFDIPFLVDWQVQEDRTPTLFLVFMHQAATNHVKYIGSTLAFDPYTSSRIAVVVDKEDGEGNWDNLVLSVSRVKKFDQSLEETILPQMGFAFEKP